MPDNCRMRGQGRAGRATGPAGPQGVKGDTGDTGPAGPQGPASVPICRVGMVVQPGDSCTYPGRAEFMLTVLDDTTATFGTKNRWSVFINGGSVSGNDRDFNDDGFWNGIEFLAFKQPDGGWFIEKVADKRYVHQVCQLGMVLQPGDSGTYPGHPESTRLRVYDSDNIGFSYGRSGSSSGQSYISYTFHGLDIFAVIQDDGSWLIIRLDGDILSRPLTPPIHERSLVDRPDEVSGWQLHPVYLIASDGVDEGLDTSGWIDDLVNGGLDFIEQRTGRRLRVDTWNGRPDVTFVRDGRSEEELNESCCASSVEHLLTEEKVLVVLFVHSIHSADWRLPGGGWAWLGGPDGPGKLAVLTATRGQAGYLSGDNWSGLFAHEVFHTLGAVPYNAPHSDGTGHVYGEGIWDLMCGLNCNGPDSENIPIDVGRDDYYGHNIPGLWDTEDSPLWLDAPTNQVQATRRIISDRGYAIPDHRQVIFCDFNHFD